MSTFKKKLRRCDKVGTTPTTMARRTQMATLIEWTSIGKRPAEQEQVLLAEIREKKVNKAEREERTAEERKSLLCHVS